MYKPNAVMLNHIVTIRLFAPELPLRVRNVECMHAAIFGNQSETDGVHDGLADPEGLSLHAGQIGCLQACVFEGATQDIGLAFELWSGDDKLGVLNCHRPAGGHSEWAFRPEHAGVLVDLDVSGREVNLLCLGVEDPMAGDQPFAFSAF